MAEIKTKKNAASVTDFLDAVANEARRADARAVLKLMKKATARLPKERLWVNPDCGLKTRGWPETQAALESMVEAARVLRAHARVPASVGVMGPAAP